MNNLDWPLIIPRLDPVALKIASKNCLIAVYVESCQNNSYSLSPLFASFTVPARQCWQKTLSFNQLYACGLFQDCFCHVVNSAGQLLTIAVAFITLDLKCLATFLTSSLMLEETPNSTPTFYCLALFHKLLLTISPPLPSLIYHEQAFLYIQHIVGVIENKEVFE